MSEDLTPSETDLLEDKTKRVGKWISHTRQHSPVNAFSPPTPPPTVIQAHHSHPHSRSRSHPRHHRYHHSIAILPPSTMNNMAYPGHPMPSTDPRFAGYHSPIGAYPMSPNYPQHPSMMPVPMVPMSAPLQPHPSMSPQYPGNMFSRPGGVPQSGGYGQPGMNIGMQPNHEFSSLGRDENGSIIDEPHPHSAPIMPMSARAGAGGTIPNTYHAPHTNVVLDDSYGSRSSHRHRHRHHRHRSPSRTRGRAHTRERERTPPPSRTPSPPRARSHSHSRLPQTHSHSRDLDRGQDRDRDFAGDDERAIPPDYVPASPGPDRRSHGSSSRPARSRARPDGNANATNANSVANPNPNPSATANANVNPIVQAAEAAVTGYMQGHGHGHKHGLKHTLEQAALAQAVDAGLGQGHAGAAGNTGGPPWMQAAEAALSGFAQGHGHQGQGQGQGQPQGGSQQRSPMLHSSGGHRHRHDHHGHEHGHGHGHHNHGSHHRSSSHPHHHHDHREYDSHPTVHSRDFATYAPAASAAAPSRPAFSRHRSQSIDDRDLQRSMARTRAQYEGGGGGGGSGRHSGGYGSGANGGYGSGTGTGGYGYQNGDGMGGYGSTGNGAYPQVIHSSPTHPTLVPIHDGKGGWVVVPPPGKDLHIVDAANRTLYHTNSRSKPIHGQFNKLRARSSSQPRSGVRHSGSPSQSFFSKFFGMGRKNVSHERGRERMLQPQPVQYVHTR
ncbi:hypothetical protein CVT25_001856 [Psilocybe cyanescens]|uniref:Uncharacterized protein n=1 Tax=Psilocybe cyanescens TaxID=93625 RepID=A0A409WQG3_PSICY|nr:hypothetical protein CVT25_001856 [Psilocybe cyanescens]